MTSIEGGERAERLAAELDDARKQIAGLKRSVEELKGHLESERQFRILVESSSDLIATLTPDGHYVYANHAQATAVGRPIEEIIGKSIWDFFSKEEADKRFASLSEVFRTGAEAIIEGRGAGGDRDYQTIVRPVRDAAGRVVSVICSSRDITERKRVEEALHQSNATLQAAMDQDTAGIAIADAPSGALRYVNDAGLLIRGGDRQAMVEGVGIEQYVASWRILDLDGRPLRTDEVPLARAVMFGETSSREFIIRREEGDDRIVWANAAPITDAQGQVTAAVVVFLDITERKLAEEALRVSEQRFRSLFDSSRDAVMTLAPPSWRFSSGNKATVEMFGARDEEHFTRLGPWELSPERQPDGRASEEKSQEMIETAMREGSHFFEWMHKRVDGATFPATVLLSKTEIAGKILLQATVRDITQRKRSEDALRASQRLIEELINAIPARVFWKDENLVFLGCNQAFARDAGFDDPKDIIGKDDYQMVWRDQADLYRTDDRLVIEKGEPRLNIEEPQTTPEGDTITLLTGKTPLRDSEGNIRGVLGSYVDITARKRAEAALRESEQRFAQLAEQSRTIAWEVDARGLYTYFSPVCETVLGYRPNEIVGQKHLYDLHPEAGREEFKTAAFLAFERKASFQNLINAIEAKDGSVVWVSTNGIPLLNADGSLLGYRGSDIDITERKRAEEENSNLEAQLQQAHKMESVGRLAGGVAHDFNNMLAVILGHAELALEQVDPAAPLHADLEEIRSSAQRSSKLTRQLLAFARKQVVAPRVLDLNEIVESMLKMVRRLIGEDIEFVWVPVKDIGPINIDPSQLDQIVANLCVNARDAIGGVGKLSIETGMSVLDEVYCAAHAEAVPGEYVWLAVSDDGCGMDEATRERLFEPFFTTKSAGDGTGLGLATVHGIVKQNRGFIGVRSEPGQGTTFTIYLPRHMDHSVPQRSEQPGGPVARGWETILVVEDEPAILKMTTRMLKRQGYAVLAASSPREAIRLAGKHAGEISLLITDVIMPEMNGRDLAKTLMSLHPGLKRLFMSGYTADVIAHHGVLDDGVHFIEKPFSEQVLAAKVREVLERR